jgi:hypothetical protein
MFLFAQDADAPEPEKYRVRPYNYGPMSRQAYDDPTVVPSAPPTDPQPTGAVG